MTRNLISVAMMETWSETIEARSKLPDLIRKLIYATGEKVLKTLDFPGNDSSQMQGWDGVVEAKESILNIPEGKSVWELGTGKYLSKKLNEDYEKRTKQTSEEARKNLTFVLVSSRKYTKKQQWIEKRQEKREWKKVLFYDADDLVQWLERTTPVSAWFLELTGHDPSEVASLQGEWERYWNNKELNLNAQLLFQENVDHYKETFENWKNNNFQQPLTIAADSDEEALGFVYCMFELLGSPWTDQSIIVKSGKALRKVVEEQTSVIIIISSTEAEKELPLSKHKPIIIIRNNTPLFDISKNKELVRLESPSREAFISVLQHSGMDYDETAKYIRQCAFSLTILRRILLPGYSYTQWSKDNKLVRKLIPITLIGCWDETKNGDKKIIQKLSYKNQYRLVEEAIREIANLDNIILWEEDHKVGVKSARDKLAIIKNYITTTDLNMFFDIAKTVLGDTSTGLQTAKERQFIADIFNGGGMYSKYIRQGICDTLILFSIHGDEWFPTRSISIATKVKEVIEGLFINLDSSTWLLHKDFLAAYAEAAPKLFLNILIEDLKKADPSVQVLFKNRQDILTTYTNNIHNLLFALEKLAWNSQYLYGIIQVLAQLILLGKKNNCLTDNVFSSLQRIFQFGLPQTSASLNIRKNMLLKLTEDFPEIGYKICLDQFASSHIATYSSRPKWRNDASGKGCKVSNEEVLEFQKEALRLLLESKNHDEQSLSKLVEIIPVIDSKNQKKIWQIVADWNKVNPTDRQKVTLRNCIRSFIDTNRVRGEHDIVTDATNIYKLLEPNDIVERYAWLFTNPGLPPELKIDNDYDTDKWFKEVIKHRDYALKEIWAQKDCEGILQLLALSDGSNHIGSTLCKIITDNDIKYIFDSVLFTTTRVSQTCIEYFIHGFLQEHKKLNRGFFVIKNIIDHYFAMEAEEQVITILKNSPVGKETWEIVYSMQDHLQTRFWLEINEINYAGYNISDILNLNEKDLEELIDQLISVKRYKFALEVIHYPNLFKKVNSKQLSSLLQLVLHKDQHQEPKQYTLRNYTIGEIFKELSERQDISQKELAQLEFHYIDILQGTNHGIPNLNREFVDSPQFFINILSAIQDSDGESSAYIRLQKVHFPKGIKDELIGTWITRTRELYVQSDLEKQGDYWVGYILSHNNKDHDNVWNPSETIKNVLEIINTDAIVQGIVNGIIDSRGAVYSTKGKREREVADKYRKLAESLAFDYPFVEKIMEKLSSFYLSEARSFWEAQEKLERYVNG